jgi:TonB-linked SusC/RagA family outer membrane protein
MENKRPVFANTLLFLPLFFLLLCGNAMAQDASLSGKITDSKNEPLIGATISVEGTTQATAADLDGNYKLSGLPRKKLSILVSALGYAKQRQSIDFSNGDQSLSVSLKEDALQLDQVVVVGYGLEQKRDVTGSISTIKAKDINNTVAPSFEQAIQGRAAGVQVTAANGVAGAPVKINIRGTNSITAGSQPLYVIDGIPMTTGNFAGGSLGSGTNALADLNPSDIESMEILKDAAATAIYGSRGANGVILITTKRGKEGKTTFNADYSVGTLNPTNILDLLSAEEHLALRDKASIESTGDAEKKDAVVGFWDNKPFTRAQADSFAALGGSDWIKTAIRQGTLQVANLNAMGGNEKTTFYVGGSYRNEKGFLVGNDYQRVNGRINLDNQASSRLKFGVSSNFSYSINNRVPIGDNGGLGAAQQRLPYLPIENPNGTFNDPYANPAWQLATREFVSKGFRNISNVSADYKILPDLSFRTVFGFDVFSQLESEFNFRNTQDSASQSEAWDRRTNVFNWTSSSYLTYSKRLKEIHNISFLLGNEVQKSNTRGVGLRGVGFANDALTEPTNALLLTGYNYATAYSFLSYFSKAKYQLKDRYTVEGSLRYDGSSKFGPGNKFGLFPALSAGWIINEEAFLKNVKAISFLKLRASYGRTGNASIGDYAWRGVYNSTNGYNGQQGIVPGSLENRDLSWEKAESFDINLDVAFFNNRLAASINYYNKNSEDLLLYLNVPTSSGYAGVLQNIGRLNNNGVEVTINTKNIDGKFQWFTDFNIAVNRNTVKDLADLPADAFESGQPGEGRVLEGYPVGQTFVVRYAGVQQSDGEIAAYNADGSAKLDANGVQVQNQVKAGTELFYDRYGNVMTFANATGNFYDNRVAAGNPVPKFIGGINNSFAYKGFDLSFLWNFVYGNTIYDDPAKQQIGNWQNQAQRPEIQDAWTKDNPSNAVPSLNNYTAINSDRFLFDGSFIRLRSVTLGYNLPKNLCEKIKMQQVRIFLNGGNLITFTKYPGWDPEVLRNVDPNSQQGNVSFSGPSYQTPQTRTLMAGIKLTF